MSLTGDLTIGVTALQAQSNAIGIVSDNLANSTTIGYRQTAPTFSELITQQVQYGGQSKNGNSSALGYFPSGVDGGSSLRNDVSGSITSTQSGTDIAVNGPGFIPVKNANGSLFYTKAGHFTANNDGNLVNTAGFLLQGWPLTEGQLAAGLGNGVDSSTAISSLQTVNIKNVSETPVPTDTVNVVGNLEATQSFAPVKVAVVANLDSTEAIYLGPPTYNANDPTANMASGSITPTFTTPFTVTDSTGVVHNMTVGYLKTKANEWSVEVYAQPATDVTGANGQIAQGTIDFNPDGSLNAVSSGIQAFPTTWTDGADQTNLAFNWGTGNMFNGITQTATPYLLTSMTAQGYDSTNPAANMTSGAVTPNFSAPITIVDSKGTAHIFNVDYLKTGTNTWAVEINADTPGDITTANGGQVAAGTVTFNGDGTLASISPALTQAQSIAWTDGSAGSNITFNFGTAGQVFGTPGATTIGKSDGLGQFDEDYTNASTANGVVPGTLTGVAIDDHGIVVASFDNNTTENLYQIPLAGFIDADQLDAQSGEVFSQTGDSGQPNFLLSGSTGVGTIDPMALEGSNVDVATELTNLIVAQTAYQAGSKLISTSDTMLTDLVQMGAT